MPSAGSSNARRPRLIRLRPREIIPIFLLAALLLFLGSRISFIPDLSLFSSSLSASTSADSIYRSLSTLESILNAESSSPQSALEFQANFTRTLIETQHVLRAHGQAQNRKLTTLLQRNYPWFRIPSDGHLYNDGDFGIVICLSYGNGHVSESGPHEGELQAAKELIRSLRQQLGSKVPIQVVYGGIDEMSKEERDSLVSAGVTAEGASDEKQRKSVRFLDLGDVFDSQVVKFGSTETPEDRKETAKGVSGMDMKVFAALASHYEKILVVEPRTGFLGMPDEFFTAEDGDKRHGEKVLKGLMSKEDLERVMDFDKEREGVLETMLFAAWMDVVGMVEQPVAGKQMKKGKGGSKRAKTSYEQAAELIGKA